MPLDAPFRLGPFVVDTAGRLGPGEPGRFPSFHLVWRGCPVHARLDGGDAAGGTLLLRAIIARVPSTAGGDAARNQERRTEALGALRGLGRAAEPKLPLRLLPDHRVAVEATRPVALPVSAVDLLTQIACFLLDLAPYLDVLAEAGVPVEAAPPSTEGMVKT